MSSLKIYIGDFKYNKKENQYNLEAKIYNKEKVGYTDPAVLLCCCFTKTKTSTIKYCAGYFGLRFAHKWVKSFCPKLETIFKYDFIGPYKLEADLLIAMRHKEQCEEHPERV